MKKMVAALEILNLYIQTLNTRLESLNYEDTIPSNMRKYIASIRYCNGRVQIKELADINAQLSARYGKILDTLNNDVDIRLVSRLTPSIPNPTDVMEAMNDILRKNGVSVPTPAVENPLINILNPSPVSPAFPTIQPGIAPMQPGIAPMQPGIAPMQPGMAPMQPGIAPMQPGVSPMQPGMTPMQPGVSPMPPAQPGVFPSAADLSMNSPTSPMTPGSQPAPGSQHAPGSQPAPGLPLMPGSQTTPSIPTVPAGSAPAPSMPFNVTPGGIPGGLPAAGSIQMPVNGDRYVAPNSYFDINDVSARLNNLK